MELFYIDRQFGVPIFIEVENGIVIRCFNESEKYVNHMNELYAGKSINFLNEDFIGRAMKGVYHHLRPLSITDCIQMVEAAKSRIRVCYNLIGSNTTPADRLKDLRESVQKLQSEQYEHEVRLRSEKERILKVHNFVV